MAQWQLSVQEGGKPSLCLTGLLAMSWVFQAREGGSIPPWGTMCYLSCPECGSNKIVTEIIGYCFTYGQGDSAIKLTTRIPMRQCEDCLVRFIDDEAESLIQAAVNHHISTTP